MFGKLSWWLLWLLEPCDIQGVPPKCDHIQSSIFNFLAWDICKWTRHLKRYSRNLDIWVTKPCKSGKKEPFLNFSNFCLKFQTSFLAIAANTPTFTTITPLNFSIKSVGVNASSQKCSNHPLIFHATINGGDCYLWCSLGVCLLQFFKREV